MKKIIYSAALVCMLAAVVSCKSTKGVKKSSKKAKEAVAKEAPAEENTETKEAPESEEAEKAEKADKVEKTEAQTPASGSSEKKETASKSLLESNGSDGKDFTGWIKSSKKNVNERFGKIQIKIKSGRGSYTLYTLNEKDKPLPVLSTANEYVTNAFYLKTSKKVYNLVTDSSIRTGAKQTKDGASIMYEIPSVAQLSVDFSCFSSQKEKEADMIKVTATIKNISSRNDDFSFKAVLDTILGEAAAYHFYTFEDVPVKNEVLYRTLQNQKWFVSKNLNTAMQLFFTGADCTVPELVALANHSTLEKNSWEPDMLSYRVFDTVLSYNNSAVCAIWKPLKLAPQTTGKVIFYIALSGDGTPASGQKYVYSKEFTEAPVEEKPAAEKNNGEKALITINPYGEVTGEEESGVATVTEFTGNEADLSAQNTNQAEAPAETKNADFYIKNMTKEHLTPEYIQSLLDRIAALEEDSPTLNRQELLQLNAELDAILTYLRQ